MDQASPSGSTWTRPAADREQQSATKNRNRIHNGRAAGEAEIMADLGRPAQYQIRAAVNDAGEVRWVYAARADRPDAPIDAAWRIRDKEGPLSAWFHGV